jgi:malonate transporter and related proteins
MTALFETLLPIFLLIGLGLGLRWREIVPEDMWRGLELLGYWVFFLALLLETMIGSDVSNLPLTGIAFTMIASFLTMAIALLVTRRFIMQVFAFSGPSYSSEFQSATRWNGFVALPVLAKPSSRVSGTADAPLVATTVTVQTAVSFFTIPLVIMLASYLQ